MSTLTFRGLDLLSALGDPEGIRIQVTGGFLMPASTRGVDYLVAARPGLSSGNRIAHSLEVKLEGHVKAYTPEMWRLLTDSLLAVLDEDDAVPGDLVAGGGYLGLADGATATITARVKNVLEGPVINKTFQTWSIVLESVDPDWVVTGSGS